MTDAFDFLTIISVALGVFLIAHYVIKYIQRRKYKLPPGPMALPLVGNMLKFRTDDMAKMFIDLRRQYGSVYSFWFGTYHSIVLSDIDVINEAFVKKASDFAGRPSLPSFERFTKGRKDIALGDYGPIWRVQRKLAHTAMRKFTEGDKLGCYLLENFKIMSNYWKSQTAPFSPRETVALLTYNIMCTMLFGEIYDKESPDFQFLLKAGFDVAEKLGNGFATDFLPSCFALLDKSKFAYIDGVLDWFNRMVSRKIQHHRDTFESNNLRDLVDHIIDAQRKSAEEGDGNILRQLTDDHFTLIILDFFLGGTDTTRELLLDLLLYVGSHETVQKKIVGELDRVIGRERLPESKDVLMLPYCEAVICETLRIGSVFPFSIPHKTMCDTSVGGYDVPKGSLVLINFNALHFDPEHWKNPEEFNPDRFIDEDGSVHKPRAWMPFSGGRRVCPGESLAKRELVYITALIFHHYTIRILDTSDCPLKPESILLNGRVPKEYQISVTERS